MIVEALSQPDRLSWLEERLAGALERPLTPAERGNAAMAVRALRGEIDWELLRTGVLRSLEGGRPSDAYYRVAKLARLDALDRGDAGLQRQVELVWKLLTKAWLAGRLDRFVVTGDIRAFPALSVGSRCGHDAKSGY